MSNYTKVTNFAAKDSLPSGNPSKVIKGTEFNTEFDNIAIAVNSKADSASPTITGTALFTSTASNPPSSTIDSSTITGFAGGISVTSGSLTLQGNDLSGSGGGNPRVVLSPSSTGKVEVGPVNSNARLTVGGASTNNCNIRLANTSGRAWELTPYQAGVSENNFAIRDGTAGRDMFIVDTNGSINIPTAAARITGDFSNATVANRVMFQSSTTNARTNISALPNGTSTIAGLDLYGSSTDPANTSLFRIANTNSEYQLEGSRTGTGTFLPMTFYTSGTEKLRIGADATGTYTFGGTAPRITGDFSNATQTSRVLFQSSTTNGATSVGLIPNGTSTLTQFTAFGSTDAANTSVATLANTGTEVSFRSAITGTGTYLPMTFHTGGSERVRIDTSGNVGIGVSNTSSAKIYSAGSVANSLSALSTLDAATFVSDNTDGAALNRITKFLFRNGGFNLAAIAGVYSQYNAPSDIGGALVFGTQTNASGGVVERMRIDSSGNVLVTNAAGLGYGTGAGGTVTQATSKSTAVTLNKPTGQITMNNAALAAGASVAFIVNNSVVTASDSVVVQPNFGVNAGAYSAQCTHVGNGSFVVRVTNLTGGSLSESVTLTFAVIKGATS